MQIKNIKYISYNTVRFYILLGTAEVQLSVIYIRVYIVGTNNHHINQQQQKCSTVLCGTFIDT